MLFVGTAIVADIVAAAYFGDPSHSRLDGAARLTGDEVRGAGQVGVGHPVTVRVHLHEAGRAPGVAVTMGTPSSASLPVKGAGLAQKKPAGIGFLAKSM